MTGQVKITCSYPQILLDHPTPTLERGIGFKDKDGVARTYMYYLGSIHRVRLGASGLPMEIVGSYVDFANKKSRYFVLDSYTPDIIGGLYHTGGRVRHVYDIDPIFEIPLTRYLLDESDLGVNGSFTTADGKTVTVTKGIITNIA